MRDSIVVLMTLTFCLGYVDRGIAGPFGLSMGMQPAEVGGTLHTHKPGSYITTEVPQPHPTFHGYLLFFAPKAGLYKIIAMGPTLSTSIYGNELRSAFDNLEKRLSSQYGKHRKFDFLQKGSIWNEPQDFMTGLLKKERTLGASWSKESGATLKDSLSAMVLEARAMSPEEGAIIVSYEFTNGDASRKELETTEDHAL